MRDFGPAKALTIKKETDDLSTIQEKQNHIMKRILSFKTKTNINRDSLLCYAQSILYELTCDGYIYSKDIPIALDAYLSNFKLSDASTTIMDGVGTTICPGINDDDKAKHTFILCCEKSYSCSRCKKIYCEYCMYETKSEMIICISV